MGMSKWKKLKLALGFTFKTPSPTHQLHSSPSNAAAAIPQPVSSSPFSRTSSSSKKTCSICLGSIKRGNGHAIFTAECSHSFHFHCIASNVKHGNHICPICRAQWSQIPLQCPTLDPSPHGRARIIPVDYAPNNDFMTVVRRLPAARPHSSRPLYHHTDPSVFNDDESLGNQHIIFNNVSNEKSSTRVEIRAYPEISAVAQTTSCDNFTVLIHLKAGVTVSGQNLNQTNVSQARTPVDLVTVLDISGSMAGTKLALLKRAMGFVIQNLSSNDRLSVIVFSSNSRRLFRLQRMSETGKQQALLAVNALIANGGTNIAEGLKKGCKVLEDRKEKNPVGSIILLSDGQDTYTVSSFGRNQPNPNYESLLPVFTYRDAINSGFKIPVHSFGFGADHDASSMHSISENSGGTFSFIESERVLQDAFAQCIGGILSVVVQELQVGVECVDPTLRLDSLKAGSYPTSIMSDSRKGFISVGDLYADEERDFLVSLSIPRVVSTNETSLLKVKCVHKDPLTKQMVSFEGEEVKIQRPKLPNQEVVPSIQVDRQRNRLQAAEAMTHARAAAEQGDLTGAISALENCRNILAETISAKSQDRLCIALDAELKEMQERMANRHVYEASGRAYILSGLSSHSWQRATARGDSTEGSSRVQSYQTPSMLQMLTRSQAMLLGSPSSKNIVQPKHR